MTHGSQSPQGIKRNQPEERNVHVFPSSHVRCPDVVVPQDEGDQDVIQVTAVQRQVDHWHTSLQATTW